MRISSLQPVFARLPLMVAAVSFAFWSAQAMAAPEVAGVSELPGGVKVLKSVQEGFSQRKLHLDVPSFALWGRDRIEEPLTFRIDSNYAAYIDQWQLKVFRTQDENKRPVFFARGSGNELPQDIRWSGSHRGKYPLRPGEQLSVVFEVRDTVGNVDRTEEQLLHSGRYLMKKQAAHFKQLDKDRSVAFDARSGAIMMNANMPVSGSLLFLDISHWPASSRLGLSGLNLAAPKKGAEARIEQVLLPGPYALSVQKIKSQRKDARVERIGTISLDVPGKDTLNIAVPSATLPETEPADGSPLKLLGHLSGEKALRLAHASSAIEARLGIGLLNPELPVDLIGKKKKRYLQLDWSSSQALWGGPNATEQAPRQPATPAHRKVKVKYPAVATDELIFPDTDLIPGSIRLAILKGDEEAQEKLKRGWHYIVNAEEGRLRMTTAATQIIQAALKKTGSGKKPSIVADYEVLSFDGSVDTLSYTVNDNGKAFRRLNGTGRDALPGSGDLAGRVLSWLGLQ